MTNLKEQLEKKRDELADNRADLEVAYGRCGFDDIADDFRAGFDAAMDELLPKLEIAIKALEFYALSWTYGINNNELLVLTGDDSVTGKLNYEERKERARQALKEIRGE